MGASAVYQRVLGCVVVLTAIAFARSAEARLWSSENGHYKTEADLISFNKELVVLKKPGGSLIAVELKELSEADRKYVASKEAKKEVEKASGKLQTWTGIDGMKVRGSILAFGRKDLVLQRRRGKVVVNDKLFEDLDELHQRLVLKIVSQLAETKLEDEKQLTEWSKALGGQPKTYTLEGVLMELESGDQVGVPFFLFSKEDLEILQPGWERWLESEKDQGTRDEESFLMRSAALAYQRDRAERRQIERMKLSLLGAATGVVNIWEVGLRSRANGRPMRVLVTAENNVQAGQIALRQNPGFAIIGVRKASY
ncbi:MAG TPA: hypothetical protein DDW52_16590 [Planctomycetaceae bacterium]|nr:hypothetical protein [Planctomycetaceae bacterium]